MHHVLKPPEHGSGQRRSVRPLTSPAAQVGSREDPDPRALSQQPSAHWTDEQLVEACLAGEQQAWAVLIHRYKTLIFSFARRFAAPPEDAADIFQLVCTEMVIALPRLRKRSSLRSWLMTVAMHQAYHWKRRRLALVRREGYGLDATAEVATPPGVDALESEERRQRVRAAISRLPKRSQELVRLLFYEDPPAPYETVAARLGLATGSIGLTRARCLRLLERLLSEESLEA